MLVQKGNEILPSIRKSSNTFFDPKTTVVFNEKSREKEKTLHQNSSKESSSGTFFQPQKIIQTRSKGNENNHSKDTTSGVQNDKGLPSELKSGLETLSGVDLSGVRVHKNSSKPDEVNAHAYTQGQDIYVASGQEKHLPHEGWHVVQQMQGRVAPTIQRKDKILNDDSRLEQEADIMGGRASQLKSKKQAVAESKTSFIGGNQVIQRAMKFEYQFKKNFLYRDTGSEVKTLPRKYGPRDYLVHKESGASLESESHGQVEFETTWEKKWPKLEKQIHDIQSMSDTMDKAPAETGSDGNTYKKFPFATEMEHLEPKKGFVASGGLWAKEQTKGEATILNPNGTTENFRSTTSYALPDNIIQTIANGEKVFVHFLSPDGKWGRVEYKGNFGWVWRNSLSEMKTDQFESNKDDEGKYTDTQLKKGEKILLKVGDSTWSPYVQISESFELEQYESYLKQYDKKFGASLITSANKAVLDKNTQTAPVGETAMDKKVREQKFLDDHAKLKNLLLMVGQYIERGRTQSTLVDVKQSDGSYKKEPGSAKYALSLLSRTHFGSIFKTLTKPEQTLFKEMVNDKKGGILPTMSLTTSSKMFVDGTSTGYNPTVYSWLISITQGGDILSVQSGKALPAAMGKYSANKEKGMNEGLVRFEARNEPDNFPTLWDIDDHALRHFMAAATDRKRDTGKDKTGLEK